MFKFIRPAALVCVVGVLAGCVGSDVERAGIGAVAGGVGAAALDKDVATGVVVGAAAGALADDVTDFFR